MSGGSVDLHAYFEVIMLLSDPSRGEFGSPDARSALCGRVRLRPMLGGAKEEI